MALNIKSREADRLARELAELTGETITDALTIALAERLERTRRVRSAGRRAELHAIFERAARLPRRDERSEDEILGYTDSGMFD